MATTNLAAFESESVAESLDYFPYGGLRIDTKTNYGGVRNKYAGTIYDILTGLNYMQARYQNSSRWHSANGSLPETRRVPAHSYRDRRIGACGEGRN